MGNNSRIPTNRKVYERSTSLVYIGCDNSIKRPHAICNKINHERLIVLTNHGFINVFVILVAPCIQTLNGVLRCRIEFMSNNTILYDLLYLAHICECTLTFDVARNERSRRKRYKSPKHDIDKRPNLR